MNMKYKPQVYSSWGLESNARLNFPCEIYVDYMPKDKDLYGKVRIILIQEPVRPGLIADMINPAYFDCYNHVFTYHQEVLEANPKAVLFIAANTRIEDDYYPGKKIFGVSTWISGRNSTGKPGVHMREELWVRKDDIKIPLRFYLSSQLPYKFGDYKNGLILGNNKAEMFDTMYHIAFDTVSLRNFFSEKLIDCFRTLTLPIYYGCTNIGDYFNTDGILIAHNAIEAIDICNGLTPEFYHSKLAAIRDNYERSENYLSHRQCLDRKLNIMFNT